MRKPIDNVEIQEPPLKELKKQKSCLRHTCLGGCGCIVIFVIIFLVLLKFAATPREKELKYVPDNFPKTIPVYDVDNIDKITFTSGKDRGRLIETAAFIPKVILSPIILTLDKYNVIPIEHNNTEQTEGINWQNFINLIKEPVGDYRDTTKIEWHNLSAKPDFITEYHQSELTKTKFEITNLKKLNLEKLQTLQFNFSLKDKNIEGVLYIKDDPKKTGTDYFTITINNPY
jgi:hypothetical protein